MSSFHDPDDQDDRYPHPADLDRDDRLNGQHDRWLDIEAEQ